MGISRSLREPALGEPGRDVVTGFTGIVTGRCTYLTGCDQIQLTPRVANDGSRRSGEWFDVDRVEIADGSDPGVGFGR